MAREAGGGGGDEGTCKMMANDKATCFPNSARNPKIPAAPFSFPVTNGFD